MSDLPGEMMNAILVAPAASIRSIRCSLTARGRSTDPSNRLPTGSSSLENASGWMRVPAPAAGMIPHMVPSPAVGCMRFVAGAVGQHLFQLIRPGAGRVPDQRPLAGALRDAPQLLVGSFDGVDRFVARGG